MLKTVASFCASLLALAACSSGGGGSSDAPADVTAALNITGTWAVTFTTGPNTTCPGNSIGSTGTGEIIVTQTPNTAAVRVELSEGGTADIFNGRVSGGVLEIRYAFNDGQGVLKLALTGGKLVGSDTFTFSADGCVAEDLIEATRISGGPATFSPSELQGSYKFTATVNSSSNPNVPVGTTAEMSILFTATGASSYDATFLSGPFALTELSSAPGDLSTCTGSFDGDSLVLTISRAAASAPFSIAIDAAETDGDIRAGGTLSDALLCTPISGQWTFNFQNGGTISGVAMQQSCGLMFEESATRRIAGLMEGNAWTGGVTFGGGSSDFSGTFSGDSFSGTWAEGAVTGSKTVAANCVSVAPGTWNLVFSAGGTPQLDPSGGSMSQSGCALTFSYVDPDFGLNLTLSGDVTGSSWTPGVSGPFAGTVANVNITIAANGQSLTGTATIGGNPVTISGSKQ